MISAYTFCTDPSYRRRLKPLQIPRQLSLKVSLVLNNSVM